MAKTKIKFLGVLGLIAIVGSTFVYNNGLRNSKTDDLIKEISFLNGKYEVVGVESLIQDSNDYISSIIKNDSFKASVMDVSKPSQDLIVKLESFNKEEKPLDNILILKLQTEDNINEIAKEYEGLTAIEYAEPNYKIKLDVGSRVQKKEVLEEEEGTKKEKAAKSIIVGLVDSGVDTSHPHLEGRIIRGWNFIDNNDDVTDEVNHGTHVAGIIVDNSEDAKIMPLKFTDSEEGSITNMVRAIKFAVDNRAQVINLSMGMKTESKTLKEAISYAQDQNVIVVAAAGNYNSDGKYYPAVLDDVISVAAVNKAKKKTYISNFGDWVDFSALGQDVLSTIPGGEFAYGNGTSQAAPVVTAKIADILVDIDEDEEDILQTVIDKLKESSKDPKGKYAKELGKVIE